ncbi:hypothetical protein [Nocardia aurantiaca]|uniref:YbaB/EbfC DNA-binding family protein n=1 Tax=Nocardia aurantiaca TaxID=2675850 RepID=A0A6I3KVX2_9NOCA|nr:hypothetical protein [Nocardia aurantiaca]MTE12615.1 hypothetical protein [Nocardia aurantiaca]
MLAKEVAVAASPDGSLSVAVGADGKVHRWVVTDRARSSDPERVVATVIELIGQARAAAYDAVRAGLGRIGADEPHSGPSGFASPNASGTSVYVDAVQYEDWQREQSLNSPIRNSTNW